MSTSTRRTFTRRDFLRFGGGLAAASLVAACTPREETSQTQNTAEPQNLPLEQIPQQVNISEFSSSDRL